MAQASSPTKDRSASLPPLDDAMPALGRSSSAGDQITSTSAVDPTEPKREQSVELVRQPTKDFENPTMHSAPNDDPSAAEVSLEEEEQLGDKDTAKPSQGALDL